MCLRLSSFESRLLQSRVHAEKPFLDGYLCCVTSYIGVCESDKLGETR